MTSANRPRLVAAAVAGLVVAAPPSAVVAQEAVYVRKHRDYDVYVQPVARYLDIIVVRETFRSKGSKPLQNGFYGYDCAAKSLRYVGIDDNRVMKDGEFHDGAYKKAHDRFCSSYKDPRE